MEVIEQSGSRVLLTGATGYVGGRLLSALVARGMQVRCLARQPERLRHRAPEGTEIIAGDVLERESLTEAFEGVETAYYLIHSMGSGGDFEAQDRRAARNFAAAAREAGVRRIVYLGGLGNGAELSRHLRSRHEVGRILCESGVQVIELRASIVLGPGSLSFEMIRALTERLPVMITPRWVEVLSQPIAIEDLLAYLVQALDLQLDGSQFFEIGGADQVSYGELMREYARQRGLRRWLLRVPVLSPRLSSLWLGLVTPLYARVGRLLIESIKHPTVVQDKSADEAFSVRPLGIRAAIAAALVSEERELAATRWCDALSATSEPKSWAGVRFGNRLVDSRSRTVPVEPARAFRPIERIGGTTGWYAFDFLWAVRGWMDVLLGGVGLRRGRRDPEHLRIGDVVDCWRVEDVRPAARLLLTAEMKLPGRAWLQYEVEEDPAGAVIRQTAVFDPVGLSGLLYWYSIYPLHALVFRGMLRGVARAARLDARQLEAA